MGKRNNPSVEGTILDDIIMLGFVDGDGTSVTDDPTDIFSFDGDDFVYAGSGDDRIWGGIGNDTLNGGDGGGDDSIWGDDGDDELLGGGGSDKLYGGDGDDDLYGGAGADNLYGDDGNDYLFGGGSSDRIEGGRGNDTVVGGGGHDTIYGNKGNNLLLGGGGDDFISTGDQTSTADGGDGDDVLEIRAKKGGDHVLSGGDGADEFQFIQLSASAQSDMVITDFALGIDNFTIDGIEAGDYLSAAGAGAVSATGDGANSLLTLSTGDTILFEGITEAAFEEFFGL